VIKKNVCRIFLISFVGMSVNACIIAWNEKDGSTFTSPVVLPVAVGVAAYNVARSSTLSMEFQHNSDCSRYAPLDAYRISIVRKDKDGESKSVVDRYVSKELEEFKFLSDDDGRYEATVFHQNQPDIVTRKSFTLGDSSKVLIMRLPCLK
jgi:hypothetical protein